MSQDGCMYIPPSGCTYIYIYILCLCFCLLVLGSNYSLPFRTGGHSCQTPNHYTKILRRNLLRCMVWWVGWSVGRREIGNQQTLAPVILFPISFTAIWSCNTLLFDLPLSLPKKKKKFYSSAELGWWRKDLAILLKIFSREAINHTSRVLSSDGESLQVDKSK